MTGLISRAPRMDPAEVAQVACLYQEGRPVAEIMACTGLSRHQVERRIARSGIQRSAHEATQAKPRRARGSLGVTEPAARLLTRLMDRQPLTRTEVAERAGCHVAHLRHLEGGGRPLRQSLMASLADVLQLSAVERGQWFIAAGYAPEALTEWTPALAAVARTSALLSEIQRAQFEAQIKQLADWWYGEALR